MTSKLSYPEAVDEVLDDIKKEHSVFMNEKIRKADEVRDFFIERFRTILNNIEDGGNN